jgi:hypothetical protein
MNRNQSSWRRGGNLRHSAQDISPRARFNSTSSSVDILRNARREAFKVMFFELSGGILLPVNEENCFEQTADHQATGVDGGGFYNKKSTPRECPKSKFT